MGDVALGRTFEALRRLSTCTHPLEQWHQAPLATPDGGSHLAALQWCAACGSIRVLQGQSPSEWTRPSIVQCIFLNLVGQAVDQLQMGGSTSRETLPDLKPDNKS
jgi:hypothetical protein